MTLRVRCSGSVYLLVLGASLLVTIIGLAALAGVRLQTRSAQRDADYVEARYAAASAVELGLLYVQDPNWRSQWPNGAWLSDKPLGDAIFTLAGIDPGDGDLTDSEYEPLVLTGIGTKGIARYKTQLTLVPVVQPLEALNTCAHAAGMLKIKAGDMVAAVGAPVSTNDVLDNDNLIDGDADTSSIDSTGTITGTLTVPAPAKPLPDSNVLTDYIGRATSIPGIVLIDKKVLTPTSSPWGAADPNGLYFIDTGGNDLAIKDSRIYGTLVVRTGSGKKVLIDNAVFLQNYRSDYPVLIVDGNLEIKNNSCDYPLSETSASTNFNPVGAPYEGQWDDDMVDEYPNEIRGLIHVKGYVTLFDNARIVGTILCEGPATIDSENTIIHDPTLYANPPQGYTFVEGMKVSPGSRRQLVD